MAYKATLHVFIVCGEGLEACAPSTLTWRPGELAASEDVEVEVRDGFATVFTVVDHDAEATFLKALLFCDGANFGQKVT